MSAHAADRLSELCATRGPVCAGLDPRPDQLPPDTPRDAYATRLAAQLAPHVAALKPQLAFFDDTWDGPTAVAHAARDQCLVIADAKRGDIGSTAAAYAHAILGPQSPFHAVTLNPYLGADSLQPFVDAAAAHDRLLFVLVHTSNPGAADLQGLPLADGRPLYERVAQLVHDLGAPHRGASGRSRVGAVVGLTVPTPTIARLRQLMPHTPFLMPGYGAQGGDPRALSTALDRDGGGVLVSASRSLTLPWAGPAPADWTDRVDAALQAMKDDLHAAPR